MSCTASIISRNYLLTAAHCIDGMQKGAVLLGSANSTANAKAPQYVDGIMHPAYKSFPLISSVNDIALLKVRKLTE